MSSANNSINSNKTTSRFYKPVSQEFEIRKKQTVYIWKDLSVNIIQQTSETQVKSNLKCYTGKL